MSKKTLRNLIITSVLLLVSLIVFGYMLFQIEAQGDRLKDQIDTLGEEKAQETSFYNLQRTAQDSATDREMINSYFLRQEGSDDQSGDDPIDLLTRIEALAPQTGVVLKNAEGLKEVTDKATGANWIELTLSFSGEEAAVDRFVKALEHMPYLLKITSLELSAQSSTLWGAKITMQVFVLNYDK